MESLIPVINDLQTVFQKTGLEAIQLPQIVVVGSQSCGKSSVLESLVKKSFLPRGTEIVTRCPVILQLNHSAKDEFCRFSTDKCEESSTQTKFTFDEVHCEIERRTDEMAGSNKGISMQPIIIQVHSPNVTNLTVVDLPGVVKNPIGDQPKDIEDQVRDLILKYINNPQAIILAVSPANADIATSESIKLAREVDPEGHRTLGVITKLDLMDRGTDANQILECKTIKLKLGMIGVVNRSQQDIIDNVDINEALNNEEKFIAKNYNHLKERMGSKYLAKRLQHLLMDHIYRTLPELKKRIDALTEESEVTLETLGTSIENNPQSKMLLMVEIIHEFLEKMRKSIKERQNIIADKKQLFAVGIATIFNELDESFQNNPNFLLNLRKRTIEAMKNSVNIERFASVEDVFKSLVKDEIKMLEFPAINCCHKIHDALEAMVTTHLEEGRFARLNDKIALAARTVLSNQLKEAKKAVKYHLDIETDMIFSSDSEFSKLLKVKVNTTEFLKTAGLFGNKELTEPTDDEKYLAALKEDLQSVTDSSPETRKIPSSFPLTKFTGDEVMDEVRYVETLITTYFNIIRRQVADFFPKCIMHHLYERSINGKLKDAIKKLTQGKESELVFEPEDRYQKRLDTTNMLKNLKQASDIICGIRL